MIDLAVRRPVATAAPYAVLVALGTWSLGAIPVELLPHVEPPRLTVEARWRAASPETMEARVTAPLEGAARQVDGARDVRSVSEADLRGRGSTARIVVEFERGTRMDFARLELRERIAALRGVLPPGVRPEVEFHVPEEFAETERPLLEYRVRGPRTAPGLARVATRDLAPALLALDGVLAVRVAGDRERVVSVVLDPARLRALDLSAADVEERLSDRTGTGAPGSVEAAGRRVALVVRTPARSVEELRRLPVARRGRGSVALSDIARVRSATPGPVKYHRIDGRPAAALRIHRRAGTNALDVAERVKGRMDSLRASLPAGVTVELGRDQSERIRSELAELACRAAAAAVVVLVVLGLFLRSPGPVAIVFATIGSSVLAAVTLLYLAGFTVNLLTLAGLTWGFGLVVDNAIVVLESVERHRGRGEPPTAAARHGARQVALPVVAATATTAVVLIPFVLLQGELRLWYVPLAWAVGFSILASLFAAFTFVPSMAARLGRSSAAGSGGRPGGVDRASDPGPVRHKSTAGPGARGAPRVVRQYRALLSAALDRPVAVAAVCGTVLVGSGWLFHTEVARGVRWLDAFGGQTYLSIRIRFPRGAGLDRTDALARSFEEKLDTLPGVDRYETRVRPRAARIRVTFADGVERTAVPVDVRERLMAYGHRFGGVDVRVFGFGPAFYGGGEGASTYSVEVTGPDYMKISEIAQEMARMLEGVPRVRHVDPDASRLWYRHDPEFEYFVHPDRAALAGSGVTVEGLLKRVSASVGGRTVSRRMSVGGRERPLSLELEGHREIEVRDLSDLRVPVRRGGEVRLGDVASIDRRSVPARIVRENQEYRRTVTWEYRGPRPLGDVVRDGVLESVRPPPGYRVRVEDRGRWPGEERTQIRGAVILAVLLIFLGTAAALESVAAPVVVLLSLPLALVGVFLAFVFTGATFTRTAWIGAIMTGGIVVNNAILVVHRIGELRERLETREAILRGTLERMRPILMTSLTTVFGLLPLLLFAGHADESVWGALVLSTVGGLVASTLLVPLAIPVAYRWVVVRGRDGGESPAIR